MDRFRGWLPLLGWLASLGAGIVLFTALGGGPLEAPPLGTPSAWGAWAAERDAVTATIAILRLVVLALSWYLVAVTTIGLVARLTRAARLVRVADALSVPLIRQLLQGALGLTLAAGVVVSSSGAAPVAAARDGGSAPVTATAVALTVDAEPQPPPATASMVAVEGVTARMVGLGPPGAAAEAVDEVGAGAEHEVAAGEHLWSIAAAHLSAHLGRPAADAEVVPHWEQLIELNRDRLANPDDPDLIFPGQRFVLPDPVDGSGA